MNKVDINLELQKEGIILIPIINVNKSIDYFHYKGNMISFKNILINNNLRYVFTSSLTLSEFLSGKMNLDNSVDFPTLKINKLKQCLQFCQQHNLHSHIIHDIDQYIHFLNNQKSFDPIIDITYYVTLDGNLLIKRNSISFLNILDIVLESDKIQLIKERLIRQRNKNNPNLLTLHKKTKFRKPS